MRSRIIYTLGGMATNARHRRDTDGWAGVDARSRARHLPINGTLNVRGCPKCDPGGYATDHAKHRAEATS